MRGEVTEPQLPSLFRAHYRMGSRYCNPYLMWLMWQHLFGQAYERIRPASLNPSGVM